MSSQDLQQPAQKTALSQSASGFVPGWTAPTRGLILRSNLFEQPQDSARKLRNLRWDGISWTTQKIGYSRHRATAFNGGAAHKEMAVHYLADGSSQFIQQVGRQVQRYDPTGDPTTEVETVLFTAATETFPCMRSFNEKKFLYVNGSDNPQEYDGTTWTPQANWPITVGLDTYQQPKLVEVFNGRACYSGFAGAPYSIVLSYFLQPSNFDLIGVGLSDPSRAGIYKVPSYLGPIVTIKSFRLNTSTNQEVLLVGCQKGFLFIQGITANDFQMVNASDRFGFVSNRCWLKVDDTALALCNDGIRPFPGNVNFSAMVNAALTYPIHPLITAMNPTPAQREGAFVIDNPTELECHWFFPGTADTHNRLGIMMSYAESAQGLFRFSQKDFPAETTDPNTFHAPSCGLSYKGMYLAGGYNGHLQHLWNTNTYNGTGLFWQYASPPIKQPTPSQSGTARGFWIQGEGARQAFTAKAFYHTGQTDGSIRRTQSPTITPFNSNSSGETILGSWILGVSAFGGSSAQTFEFNPIGAGRIWEIELSGNTTDGDFSFVGIFSILIGGSTRQ